jgi:hypothetical protein
MCHPDRGLQPEWRDLLFFPGYLPGSSLRRRTSSHARRLLLRPIIVVRVRGCPILVAVFWRQGGFRQLTTGNRQPATGNRPLTTPPRHPDLMCHPDRGLQPEWRDLLFFPGYLPGSSLRRRTSSHTLRLLLRPIIVVRVRRCPILYESPRSVALSLPKGSCVSPPRLSRAGLGAGCFITVAFRRSLALRQGSIHLPQIGRCAVQCRQDQFRPSNVDLFPCHRLNQLHEPDLDRRRVFQKRQVEDRVGIAILAIRIGPDKHGRSRHRFPQAHVVIAVIMIS